MNKVKELLNRCLHRLGFQYQKALLYIGIMPSQWQRYSYTFLDRELGRHKAKIQELMHVMEVLQATGPVGFAQRVDELYDYIIEIARRVNDLQVAHDTTTRRLRYVAQKTTKRSRGKRK